MLHILDDSFLPDHFLDLALGFDVVRIRVENLLIQTRGISARVKQVIHLTIARVPQSDVVSLSPYYLRQESVAST